MPQRITRNLYVRKGTSDKVYNVTLEPQADGWVVNIERGRRNSNLIRDTKTPGGPIDYDSAYSIFADTVNGKINKSKYQENFNNHAIPDNIAPVKHEQVGAQTGTTEQAKHKKKPSKEENGFVMSLDVGDLLFKM